MAFVSLFNVITQDVWPTDPPYSLYGLRGRVLLAARSIDKLKMRMERWAKVRGRDRDCTRLYITRAVLAGGRATRCPGATCLSPHITDEEPRQPKFSKVALSQGCANAHPVAHSCEPHI